MSVRVGSPDTRTHGGSPLLSRLARYLWALPNTLVGVLFVPAAMLPGGRMQVVTGVLEIHGPLIAAILRHCVLLRGGVSAITFGHVVLGCDRLTLDANRRHERVHVRQCELWGPAFIPAYLIAGLWALTNGRARTEGTTSSVRPADRTPDVWRGGRGARLEPPPHCGTITTLRTGRGPTS